MMSKINSIPNWIQERFGRRRLDSKTDENVQEVGKHAQDIEAGSVSLGEQNIKEECWIPVFCNIQMKVASWFQGKKGSRRYQMDHLQPNMQRVPQFGRRRL